MRKKAVKFESVLAVIHNNRPPKLSDLSPEAQKIITLLHARTRLCGQFIASVKNSVGWAPYFPYWAWSAIPENWGKDRPPLRRGNLRLNKRKFGTFS